MTHSGWHVGLVAVCLMVASGHLLGVKIDEMLLVASAAGAFLVYVVDRAWSRSDGENHPDRVRWWYGHGRSRWVLVAVLFGVAVAAGVQLPWEVLMAGVLFGLVGMWYAWPLPRRSLKMLTGRGRVAVIAVMWGAGVVVLPALGSVADVSWSHVVLLAAYRASWLLPNVLASEFADREGDARTGYRSLTRCWSIKTLQGAAVASVIPAAALVSALLLSGYGTGMLLDAAGMVVSIVYIVRLKVVSDVDIMVLDLVAAWPLIPVLLAGAF